MNSLLIPKTRTRDVVRMSHDDRHFRVIFIRYNFISACDTITWCSIWELYEIFTWMFNCLSFTQNSQISQSYISVSRLHIPRYLNLCSRKHNKISLYTRYSASKTRFRLESIRDILVTNWWTRNSYQKHVWFSHVTTSYQCVLRSRDFQDETHTRYSHDWLISYHSQRSNFSIFHIISVPYIFLVIFICVQENTRKSHYILVIQRAKLVSG